MEKPYPSPLSVVQGRPGRFRLPFRRGLMDEFLPEYALTAERSVGVYQTVRIDNASRLRAS
jgi:hypothetical protein